MEFRVLVLLCGGAKSSQENDIKTAKRIANEWKDSNDNEEGQ